MYETRLVFLLTHIDRHGLINSEILQTGNGARGEPTQGLNRVSAPI